MLPTKERSRPIDVGRSPGRSRRKSPSSARGAPAAPAGTGRASPTPTGPAPGPPPPCGVQNVLWTLKCMTSKPGLARLEPAEDRVEVGAVHVGQGAGLVDRVEELADPRLEQPERRRVRDHHGGGPRTERGPERVEVDAAVGRRRDGDRPEAGHRGGRRVRPVRAVRDEDLGPLEVARADGGRPGSSGCRSARPGRRPPAGG